MIEYKTGCSDELLTEQLLVLIEAATAAVHREGQAMKATRAITADLVATHHRPSTGLS